MQDPQARAEIEALLTRYAVALDTRDWERLKTCFTSDARVQYPGAKELRGPDATAAFCESALRDYRATQHLLGSFDIAVEGDTASTRTYLTATHLSGDEAYVLGGTYTDTLVRRDGEWRIAHRLLTSEWTEYRPLAKAR